MTWRDFLTDLFQKREQQGVLKTVAIRADRTAENGKVGGGQAIHANRDYFRVWLAEMYLADGGTWFQTVYPVVHSLVTLGYAGSTVELPYVAGPTKVQQFTQNHLNHVMSLNHPLTTLLPFKGGIVELDAGLLSLPDDNMVRSFLGVLGNFADLLKVPQLSSAIQLADKVAGGIQELVAPKGGKLHVGLHQAFGSGVRLAPLRAGGGFQSGYHVALLTQDASIDEDTLWVVDGQLRRGATLDTCTELSGTDYMLFRIESTAYRDDWQSFSTILTPVNASLQALSGGDKGTAEKYVESAKLVAMTSPDFTQVDQLRVADAIGKLYAQAQLRFHGQAKKRGTHPARAKPKASAGPAAPKPVDIAVPPTMSPAELKSALAAVQSVDFGQMKIRPEAMQTAFQRLGIDLQTDARGRRSSGAARGRKGEDQAVADYSRLLGKPVAFEGVDLQRAMESAVPVRDAVRLLSRRKDL